MFHRKTGMKRKQKFSSYEELKQEMNNQISNVLRQNPYEMVRTQKEIEGNLKFKRDLRKAIKNCVVGDYNAKIFIRDFMKEILVVKFGVTEEVLDQIFHFQRRHLLSPREKFSILLYQYEKQYQAQAFTELIEKYHLADAKKSECGELYYEISREDIEHIYAQESYIVLSFVDKINIAAQRLFEDTKGNGLIDSLFYLKLDGISGGVSGSTLLESDFHIMEANLYSYQSVWIFYKGKSIYLSFLHFPSEKEFIRVCKNIYRYQTPGQLSQVKGYIVNEMADGSRVAVARPPFCESWVFFIRKFDSVVQKNMEDLLTEQNKKLPIQLIKWIIKGCQVIAITGEQGSGKTTLLMSMIQFIKPSYNLRVQELAFELHLRKLYPKRNIVSFRETNSISGQEGLDFQKKTDGAVNILGEVSTNEVCSWMIQMAQVASSFTLFTHHAKSTKDLIFSFRNALLMKGGFSDERIATEQVIRVLNFDVHMRKAEDGHRYIERISEIIEKECSFSGSTDQMYEIRELLVYSDGAYHVANRMSEKSQRRILEKLSQKERQEFVSFMHDWREQNEE